MRLELSPAADADLTAIASSIARDNPPRALTFVDELEAACAKLLDFPQSVADRSEIRAGLRSKPHGNYVIFYSSATPSSGSIASCMVLAISRPHSRRTRPVQAGDRRTPHQYPKGRQPI